MPFKHCKLMLCKEDGGCLSRIALRLSLFPQSLTDSEHPLNWQRMVGDSVLNTLQCLAIIPYALRS